MNLTAIFESLGRHDLSMAEHGYRPLKGYQDSLKQRAAELVEGMTLADIGSKLTQVATAELDSSVA
jgi:hypothetical protein